MRFSIWRLSGGVVLLAAMAAGPLTAQQHGEHHRGERGGMEGMHAEMMEHCPMAGHGMMMHGMMEGMGEGMMGPAMHLETLLERADEMDLSEEQVAELGALADRQEEAHRRMMEGMEELRELLTDEQLEMLRERQRSHMRQMHRHMQHMHGDDDEAPPHDQ